MKPHPLTTSNILLVLYRPLYSMCGYDPQTSGFARGNRPFNAAHVHNRYYCTKRDFEANVKI